MHVHPLDVDPVSSVRPSANHAAVGDPMGKGSSGTEVLLQGFNWECHAQRNPNWYD